MAIPTGQYDIPPTARAPAEILGRWLEVLGSGWIALAVAGAVGGVALWAIGRRARAGGRERALHACLVGAALAAGLWLAFGQRSLLDDAFISFRYADNWARGYGPVFNVGERVQGYTNFLWTALLALGEAATGQPPTVLALVLGPLAFAANVVVIALLGRRLGVAERSLVPWAAVLFAVDRVATSYATTGLETGAASLFVDLGLLAALSSSGTRGAAGAGLAFTAASLCRLDHGLFQAIGLGLVAWRTRSPRAVAAFLAPALALPAYLGWAWSFYGEPLPNTFYAKANGGWYASQALVYLEVWALGSWAFVTGTLALGWAIVTLLRRSSPAHDVERAFAAALLLAVAAWQTWLLRVGGDFMYGRFYLVLLPWLLLGAERAAARARVPGWAMAAVLGLAVRGVPIVHPGATEWWIADEPTFYPLKPGWRIEVDHHSWRIGERLRAALADRQIRPVLATSGPGMVAYLSGLETVDTLGLTDRAVARGPVLRRGRPGHEHAASMSYLAERGARFGNVYPRDPWGEVTSLDLGPGIGKGLWFIVSYDARLMRRIQVEAPEIGFTDMERWLDRYVDRRLARLTPAQARADLAFLDPYFFDVNGPGRWRAPIAAAAGAP